MAKNNEHCKTDKIEALVTKAAYRHDVPAERLIAKTKNRPACLVREMVWYVCYHTHNITYHAIADYFAGRAHSSVRRGIKTIAGEIEVNTERRQQVKELEEFE